jgi:hypothetical protein
MRSASLNTKKDKNFAPTSLSNCGVPHSHKPLENMPDDKPTEQDEDGQTKKEIKTLLGLQVHKKPRSKRQREYLALFRRVL